MAQRIITMALTDGMAALATLVGASVEAYEALSAAAENLDLSALEFIPDQLDIQNLDSILDMDEEEGGTKVSKVTLFEELQIQVCSGLSCYCVDYTESSDVGSPLYLACGAGPRT
eukprot:SAG11_NODE_93_length_17080_cov_10.504093_14_plen_115_part_00